MACSVISFGGVGKRHQWKAEQMAKDMVGIAKTMRTQVSEDSQASMREVASRYLDMLQRGFVIVGAAETPLKSVKIAVDHKAAQMISCYF